MNPAPYSRFDQSLKKASRSSPSGSRWPGVPQPSGMLSSSQERRPARNAASSGVSRKSMGVGSYREPADPRSAAGSHGGSGDDARPMNGQELIDEAVDVLEASDAIDHWQNYRERVEAEELLSHLIGPGWK